jgi:hypothetical protein
MSPRLRVLRMGIITYVCRLRKALYGLKQAPRAWHKTLNEKLEVMGYDVCKSDAGVYVRCSVDGGK